jgi:hypothetical protein
MARTLKLTGAVAALLVATLLAVACGEESPERTSAGTAAEGEAVVTESGEVSDDSAAADAGNGGGEKRLPSDREQVKAAIEALLTDSDSGRVCRRVMTDGLVQTAYGDLQGCLSGRGNEPLARSVRIRSLVLEGDAAGAEAIPTGGIYSGETLEVEAVRDPGGWRIDGFIADIPVGP